MSDATITETTGSSTDGVGSNGGRPAPSRVYAPESPLREPLTFLATVAGDLRAARPLAWRLFVRDISAQYRQTALGYLWAGLPAVLSALVWFALQSAGVLNVKTGQVPYIAYVLTGTIFWQLFVDALNAPLKQLTQNRAMLNRLRFPTEAVILSGIAQVLFSFVIKLVVLGVVLAASGAPVKWTAPAVLLPALVLVAVGTVIGIWASPAGMLYQDIQQGLTVIVAPLMFFTPVIYSMSSAGQLKKFMRVNPLTPMFEATREFLFGGVGPYLGAMGIVFAVTVVLGLAGWLVYRLSLPILIERLDA